MGMVERDLEGRTAIVTGSSRGIGKEIVRTLVEHGANAIVNYVDHKDDAIALQWDWKEAGGSIEVVEADVSQRDQVDHMVSVAVERFGGVNILVNNAGITQDRTLLKMDPEAWERVLAVNLTGAFNCCQAVIPHMIEAGMGSVINISSIVGQQGGFGQTNYAASKAGLVGFTKALARECARHDITVNAICPGYIETDMLAGVPETVRGRLLEAIPLGRFGSPEDVAGWVYALVRYGTYVTGQCLNVNGGMYV